MDQNASTALIFSIVAVVLGALGLVGGVIGYVQGTAALRRASLTRQRASAAEEAALGAKAQAEQSARTAQDALDRISRLQVRSLGDVADQPTGPLLLPPRVLAPPPREPITIEPAGPIEVQPTTGPIALAAGPTAVEASFFSVGDEQPTAPPAPDTQPSEPPLTPIRPTEPPATTQQAEDPPQTDVQPTDPPEVAVADQPQAIEPPSDEPEAIEPPLVEPPAATTAVEAPPQPEPRTPRHATGPIPIGTASAALRMPIVEASADDVRDAEAPVPEPVLAEQAETPGESGLDPSAPARSATGQVTAGAQEAPPMDWAEVLRTGAIPLPNRSRGTYSAPAKGKKRVTGPARFEVRAIGRQRFEVVNIGAEEAQLVAVEGAGEDRHLVRPVQTRPVAVAPGASLAFSLLRVEGRQVSVQVTWQRNGEPQSTELPLP